MSILLDATIVESFRYDEVVLFRTSTLSRNLTQLNSKRPKSLTFI